MSGTTEGAIKGWESRHHGVGLGTGATSGDVRRMQDKNVNDALAAKRSVLAKVDEVVMDLQAHWDIMGPDLLAASGKMEMTGKQVQEAIVDYIGTHPEFKAMANEWDKLDRVTKHALLDKAFPRRELYGG